MAPGSAASWSSSLIRHLALSALGWLLVVALTAGRVDAAPGAPADFVIENAAPHVVFNTPTAIAFVPDGRLLVAEKRGVVWVVENGRRLPDPLWSAETEVLNSGDRGLVGLAVDPNYAVNHAIYFFYTVDPDSNGVDDDSAAFGRLTRFRTLDADSNRIDPASRTVLIGATWRDGIPRRRRRTRSTACGSARTAASSSPPVMARTTTAWTTAAAIRCCSRPAGPTPWRTSAPIVRSTSGRSPASCCV